jgi:ferric-dicitrate binding protein FerR (iron transport regulator)/chitodextrinase
VSEEQDLLIARLLEGDLATEEERRVRALLEADAAFRREAADLVRTDRLLRYRAYLLADRPDLLVGVTRRIECEQEKETKEFAEAVGARLGAAGPPASRPVSRRVSSRAASRRIVETRRQAARRGWLFAGLGAAAAALLAVGIAMLPGKPVEAARGWDADLASADGEVELVRGGLGAPAAAGMGFRPGDALQTGAEARATVRYSDSTRVEMNEKTRLALGGEPRTKRPTLEEGDIYVQASRQLPGRPMVLNPGRYDQVEILGTEFELSRPEGRTVLKMVAGDARFGPAESGAAVAVRSGYASEAQPGAAPGSPQPFNPDEIALWRSGRKPPVVAKVEPQPEPPPPPPPPPPPAPPTAKPLSVTTDENAPKALTLAADPGEASTTFAVETGPAHGKLSGDPPQLTYTPDQDYSGPDSFTFTAGRAGGPASSAKVSITIRHVNRPPVANPAAQPVKGFAPLAVRFDASDSSDADGKIAAYFWKFGDGAADQRTTVSHTYTRPGVYAVELTVTDDQGAAATGRVTVTVERDPDELAAPSGLNGHRGGRPVAFILSWKDNSDNEEGFRVERTELPADAAGILDMSKLKYQLLATVGPNVTQAKVQLTPTPNKKSTFYFRVCAFNAKTGRTSPYAAWSVTWDPKLPNGTLNWPPPPPAGTK